MSPSLGIAFMGLALVAAFISIIAFVWGDRLGEKRGESITNAGYLATFGVFGAVTIAVAILLSAFMAENFAFKYVAENHSTDVSNIAWLFKVSGIWAGREGSLLFWEFLLAIFAAWIAYKRLSVTDRLSNIALAVTNFIQIFFLVALFIETNNPFLATPADWLTASGELLTSTAMNPLLQHWAMILHPPTLFIGYAGLAIPFAYAMAALIVGDASSAWVKLVDRITVFSWLFLGIGIGLGAIWAYVVLGWGGYWAWDPVENASLLPWLTGVGLLHSFTVYRRRDSFKGWSIMLAAITFVLVLLGTFITRSGVVQSVHAFQKDPWSLYWFLAMMVGSLAVAGIGLWARRKMFRSRDEFESLASKEGSYYFNNVLMLAASILIAYWTLAPALPTWLPGGGQSFGPDTYDPISWFLGVLYVFIMAVCPILSWRKTDGAAFWSRAKWPTIGGAGLGAVLLVIWWTQLRPNWVAAEPDPSMAMSFWHNIWAPIALLVGAFAIAVSVYLFVSGTQRRVAAKGESFGTAFWRIITKARQQSGGYLTHLGIGIILIGLVGSAMFVDDVQMTLSEEVGQSFEVVDYTFTYMGVREVVKINGDVDSIADFTVSRNGRSKGTLSPSILYHDKQGQTTRHVDIISEPLRDIFFIFEGIDQAGNLSLNILVNPLIWFAWFGFILTIVGSTLALWPKKARAA